MTEENQSLSFDEWFDDKFPKEHFGSLGEAFRQSIKTDVAKAAFKFGIQTERERCLLLIETLEEGLINEITSSIRNTSWKVL